jgi:hypothetical protein
LVCFWRHEWSMEYFGIYIVWPFGILRPCGVFSGLLAYVVVSLDYFFSFWFNAPVQIWQRCKRRGKKLMTSQLLFVTSPKSGFTWRRMFVEESRRFLRKRLTSPRLKFDKFNTNKLLRLGRINNKFSSIHTWEKSTYIQDLKNSNFSWNWNVSIVFTKLVSPS